VTPAAGTPGAVRVYWRPGCPYCAMLRLGLRGARVPAEWVNIWEDSAAAARVRVITGGDETVPTVEVGTRAMVNPSARQVAAAVRDGQPGIPPASGQRGRIVAGTRGWPHQPLAAAAGGTPFGGTRLTSPVGLVRLKDTVRRRRTPRA